jgi:hypothetical protein
MNGLPDTITDINCVTNLVNNYMDSGKEIKEDILDDLQRIHISSKTFSAFKIELEEVDQVILRALEMYKNGDLNQNQTHEELNLIYVKKVNIISQLQIVVSDINDKIGIIKHYINTN